MAKKADSEKAVKSSKAAKSDKNKPAKAKDAKKKGGIKKYFRDLKSEIKKVVWPSREKVVNNTGVVLAVMVVVGLLLFGIDTGLSACVEALLTIGG
ncbi:MAG: preprotein translocase subunit SecE [Oscillospiraceae bacterium]